MERKREGASGEGWGGGVEEGRRVRGKSSGRSREEGLQGLGVWRMGREAKEKWERERERVMGLERMHEVAGNEWSG